MSQPHSGEELVSALRQAQAGIAGYFSTIPTAAFFEGTEFSWSPAHHLQHLTQSNEPVARALNAPKLLLKLVALGQTPKAERGYAQIRDIYRQALAEGRAQATGRYAPRLNATLDQAGQEGVIEAFSKAAEDVAAATARWADPDLDAYALPHPVLGQLSVREMLFFTLYHNQHHLEGVRSKLRG